MLRTVIKRKRKKKKTKEKKKQNFSILKSEIILMDVIKEKKKKTLHLVTI